MDFTKIIIIFATNKNKVNFLMKMAKKYVNGYVVDKENEQVIYSDEKHIYFDKSDFSPFVSVTTLIGEYKQKFDGEFWSAYKALEALTSESEFKTIKSKLLETKKWNNKYLDNFNIDINIFLNKQQEILDSYEEKKNISCERGTKIHTEFENQFYEKQEHSLQKYNLGGVFKCIPHRYELDLEKGVYPEYLISYISPKGNLKIAGQIDLLIKDGNDIWILDYKSNKEIKQQSYYNPKTRSKEMMKFPINNIQDCNFYHYSLQLSLYAFLLQQYNPEFNIKGLQLIHIDHDNKETTYECEYLKTDVIKLLKHYTRTSNINKQLEADKPIKF